MIVPNLSDAQGNRHACVGFASQAANPHVLRSEYQLQKYYCQEADKMALRAELTKKDKKFLEQSLNGPMWKVILMIGTPLDTSAVDAADALKDGVINETDSLTILKYVVELIPSLPLIP